MSSKRPPAPPPVLPGFTYIDVLGSGGFADVFLYEQQLPRRRVAVKVMLPDRMAGGSAEQFAAEANVMALLSTHPAIVTIYQAGVSDDGRPYLVMEYCPRPNLQVRSRAAAFSVAEALRVGVQVAAAVETAHRAGILHRDIKPANILVTEYNRPALTDFGIATTSDVEESAGGMSIPWSPPEAFVDDSPSGVATDVYALGATIYTLLAGRSPFEKPGGRNGGADLIERIETQPVPALERPDAPVSLQSALERAMAKRPGDRFESAVAFARALQRVQIELSHSVTPIDILDDSPAAADDGEVGGELTRVRGIVSIEPQTSPSAGSTRRRDQADAPAQADSDDATLLRGPVAIVPTVGSANPPVTTAVPDVSATVRRTSHRGAAPGAPAHDTSARGAAPEAVAGETNPAAASAASPPRSRRGLWIKLGAAAAVMVIGGIAVAASMLSGDVADPQDSPTASVVVPQNPASIAVPVVADLTGEVQGANAVFTWTNPDPHDGDGYLWLPYTLAGDGQTERVTEPTVTLPVDAGGTTCIAVRILRADGSSGDETRTCTP